MPMTRDEYKQMRITEVGNQIAAVALKRGNSSISQKERDQAEYQYQSLLQQQADWERGGFWTPNEETAYQKNYKQYQGLQ